MTWLRKLALFPFLSACICLAGCEVDVNEGPLEETGENLDEAIEETEGDGEVEIDVNE